MLVSRTVADLVAGSGLVDRGIHSLLRVVVRCRGRPGLWALPPTVEQDLVDNSIVPDRGDTWLENDARFLARVEKARESVRAGQGVRLEDLE